MSFTLHPRALAVLACFIPLAVAAQPTTSPVLEPIVVTPSRIAQLESEVVGDVSVIDQDTLARAGQSSVAELLSRVPGIQISNNGGPQTQTSIFIRGNESKHTLVLIDGIRINSSVSSLYNLQAINPEQIERIEVLRGAGSSLYGAEAIGGVINIITKKGQTDRPIALNASMGLGTYNTFKSSAGVSGSVGGFDYNLLGTLASSSGFNATNPKSGLYTYNSDDDGYESHSVNANLGYAFNDRHRLDAQLLSSYMDGDYDGGDHHDTHGVARQQVYSLTSTNQVSANWTSRLSINEARESYHDFAPWGDSTYRSKQRSYTWQNDFSLSTHQHLSALFEHQSEQGTHTQDQISKKRLSNTAALIYNVNLGPHHAQASLRHDYFNGLESRTTGGIGYDFDISNHWKLGASYNTGFKMPSFTDLYITSWGGNPDLKAEKSKNVEARIAYTHETGSIKLVAYQNRIQDLIQANQDTSWKNFNVAKAKIKGYTLSFDQRYDNIDLWGSIDLTNPRNKKTNARLARRAAQVYNLGVAYNFNHARLGAEYTWHGKRLNTNHKPTNEPTIWMNSFSLLNLTGEYELSKTLTAQVRWDNVFNKKYEYAYGYNTPGSNIFINLQWRM